MKHYTLVLAFFFIPCIISWGQVTTEPIDIHECIQMITASIDSNAIGESKKLTEQEFIESYADTTSLYNQFLSKWLYLNSKSLKLRKYYAKSGINDIGNVERIIVVALYRHLLNIPFDHDQLVKEYANIEKRIAKEDKIRGTADSLRGIYIPKDLKDCFKQIDGFWSETTKAKVKNQTEEDFIAHVRLSFGVWMTSNWQLWAGSRLSIYFNKLGIFHPDDMTAIILTSYHRYLKGDSLKVDEQIQYYKQYWQKLREKNKK